MNKCNHGRKGIVFAPGGCVAGCSGSGMGGCGELNPAGRQTIFQDLLLGLDLSLKACRR
jgi:hypothetical protein